MFFNHEDEDACGQAESLLKRHSGVSLLGTPMYSLVYTAVIIIFIIVYSLFI